MKNNNLLAFVLLLLAIGVVAFINNLTTPKHDTFMPMGSKWDICYDQCSRLPDDIAECLEVCVDNLRKEWMDFR